MDYLSIIKQPIAQELDEFLALFNQALTYPQNGLLESALKHICQRGGKRMRPILTLLMAKNYGEPCAVTYHSAIALELLHTASLVHDDVVDESGERRGQASLNASFNNKVAVLVGDYVLSTALLHVSYTHQQPIVENLSQLGRTLAAGELQQLDNIQCKEISEDVYYQIIEKKTAVLFESCATLGALSVGADNNALKQASKFGYNLGMMFQIRDDIFDYFDAKEIGKPTGNDMTEVKLTLPVIYALHATNDAEMLALAHKVKAGTVKPDEIATLVRFTKEHGGIEYAEQRMAAYSQQCMAFIDANVKEKAIRDALTAYVDYVVQRNY